LKLNIAVCVLFLTASAQAATSLTGFMTVDNLFSAYISTSDSVQGTLIGSGNSWPTTVNFSTLLTPGVTNFLHIVATDQGAPAMFIGDFTLSDASFQFANGTQHLLTNTTDWGFNNTGFTGSYSTPLDEGPNGTSPWSTLSNISVSARFIWDNPACGSCTTYFSTAITSLDAPGVPEPSTYALLIAGFAMLSRKMLSSRRP
jgi:PEP-CTERM motif